MLKRRGWRIEYSTVVAMAAAIAVVVVAQFLEGASGLSLWQQVIFHEEYARADAPARVNHLGEELLGPTLIAFGTEEQKARFLPRIAAVEELWAQGYSEPNAGSDLANVQTRARLVSTRSTTNEWVIDGQKVWTSNAHLSQWVFVLARTEPGSAGTRRTRRRRSWARAWSSGCGSPRRPWSAMGTVQSGGDDLWTRRSVIRAALS